ncbi:MAG: hypothetical protein ACXVZO_06520 [Gaiellaceae bacterium]
MIDMTDTFAERRGSTAIRHQPEDGAGCFDRVLETISGGTSSTPALLGSTESARLEEARAT